MSDSLKFLLRLIALLGTLSGISYAIKTWKKAWKSHTWQTQKAQTTQQFEKKQSDGSPKLEIVAGVDLGTSSTKVVLHVFNVPGEPAFAVPFDNLANEDLMKHLQPTRLFVSRDGSCSLKPAPEASLLTDIKIGLMQQPAFPIKSSSGPPCREPATVVATAYLALILREACRWFVENKKNDFGNLSLDWSFNLGLPAAIDDNPELRKTFDSVGKAAWLVSQKDGTVTVANARRAIENVGKEWSMSGNQKCDFNLVPEVIAEVVGYARSRFRNDGLHLLVDIGASTLDVCSFILHQNDGEDHFPILTAEVKLLGAKQLHDARIKKIKRAIPDYDETNLFDVDDPLCVVPDTAISYLPQGDSPNETLKTAYNEAESMFAKNCQMLLHGMFMDLKRDRDPSSPRWSEAFPIFICGGASAMQTYQNILDSIHEWLPTYIPSSKGIQKIRLPKPESLQAEINNEDYHRLAVAWGLSHQSFNIGTYKRPSEIEDCEPPPIRNNIEDKFVSKDMV